MAEGLFPRDSVAWRVNAEAILLLGGPRALLMQVSHPSVAAAVWDHSDFRKDPYERLWRTLDRMVAISFGDPKRSREAAEGVAAVHRRVVGRTPTGREYHALDPGLLLWVHATLVDTSLVVYERYVHPLSQLQSEDYYRDMKRQARVFGVPEELLPEELGDLRAYVDRMVRETEVGEEARALAAHILAPPLPPPLRPLRELLRLVTVDLLPPPLRRGYGLSWSMPKAAALRAAAASVRVLLPFVPDALRLWPHARAAAHSAASGPSLYR